MKLIFKVTEPIEDKEKFEGEVPINDSHKETLETFVKVLNERFKNSSSAGSIILNAIKDEKNIFDELKNNGFEISLSHPQTKESWYV